MTKIFFNGRLADEGDALLRADSRAARFGDGVFETIPVHSAKPYLWHYHMERMAAGLAALRIPAAGDLLERARELLRENTVTDGLLRISVSRAGKSAGYLPSPYPSHEAPDVIMETLPRPAMPAKPITLWLSSYERISPRALPTHCKLAQGMNAMLARMEATDNGCHEALLLGHGGILCEASSANLFWRKRGVVYTPSIGSGALAGVTRRRMMELSPYPVHEGLYPLQELQDADAVVLTTAAQGIVAVGALHGRGWSWDSATLATELNALRQADIARDLLA